MLPIDDVLPELKRVLSESTRAVLVAPPGAGKSTRVPLALLEEPWVGGRKIVMLAPRRLAARAAATRMAEMLGQSVGRVVGFRVRLESCISRDTRIEVVTEGVFTRMILDDPGLEGIAAVLFDEYHERSLDADLGLALALDAQGGLRPDLRLLVMSATIDAGAISQLIGDAPVITSEGRSHPIETRYLGREPHRAIEPQMASAITRALDKEQGDILAFLPGGREIRRTARLLEDGGISRDVIVAPLYGALEAREQDRALTPAAGGMRKVILATSIAETSLTIDGVRVVVDSGLARMPRYEPGMGLTALVTERASRAAVDQRRGRAGRTAPGLCLRLWDEPETRALRPFPTPEILDADLSSLRLALADWGVGDRHHLSWLDFPPEAAWNEAIQLLSLLGALDAKGRLTAHGKALMALPLTPRLAHMVIVAAGRGEGLLAARIALLLGERDLAGDDVDLRMRLEALDRARGERAQAALGMANRWLDMLGAKAAAVDQSRAGSLLALAFPERIAKARPGRTGEFLMANGRGVTIDSSHALAQAPYLAIANLAGDAARQRILLAAPLDEHDIERDHETRIEVVDSVEFDTEARAVKAQRQRRLGAIVLRESQVNDVSAEQIAAMLIEGLRGLGLDALPWSVEARALRSRLGFSHRLEPDTWPDVGDATLLADLAGWLGPFLVGCRALKDIAPSKLDAALLAGLSHTQRKRLDLLAPTHVVAPSGQRLSIDYDAPSGPTIAARVQDLFGMTVHPSVGDGRIPLVIELLSPARRPVQVTRDLPGFWAGSYQAVRAAMRGRYPRHPWPEDPRLAQPLPRRR